MSILFICLFITEIYNKISAALTCYTIKVHQVVLEAKIGLYLLRSQWSKCCAT